MLTSEIFTCTASHRKHTRYSVTAHSCNVCSLLNFYFGFISSHGRERDRGSEREREREGQLPERFGRRALTALNVGLVLFERASVSAKTSLCIGPHG